MTQYDTPTTPQVQAMIDAAGGGNGANIKSGVSNTPAGTTKQVNFVTPFPSNPRVVIASYMTDRDVWVTQVTTDYFKWWNNETSKEAIIHWIATTAGNA